MTEQEAPVKPAARISEITVSTIAKISGLAREMRAGGKDVIDLSMGEPDFDTPDHIKDAAVAAIRAGDTKYTAMDGTPALKDAIRAKFERDQGLSFERNEITVGTGAKQILFNALMATVGPGDEVIIPAPYWVSYVDIVKICGARPVIVECAKEDGFRLDGGQLEQAISGNTRWLILNSPNNPSGAAYGEEHLRPILDVLLRHPHVWTLSDDIYEHIVYDGFRFVTPLQLEPKLRDRVLTVNGVSKAYAMTGWRIGYGAGPRSLIKAMAIVQSQSTSNPSSVGQAAAVAALNDPQDIVPQRTEVFQQRRDIVVSMLNEIEGIDCRTPEGAFYVFPSCQGLIGKQSRDGRKIGSDLDFVEYVLRSAGVAAVPGSAFGSDGHFRISYATSTEALEMACRRIAQACDGLE